MNPTHRKQKNIADQEHSIHHFPKKKHYRLTNYIYSTQSNSCKQTNKSVQIVVFIIH